MKTFISLKSVLIFATLLNGCWGGPTAMRKDQLPGVVAPKDDEVDTDAPKLTATDCVDPDLNQLLSTAQITLCDGTLASGTLVIEVCSRDGEEGCLTNEQFKAADTAAIANTDLSLGKTIAGIAGAGSLENHVDCASNGETGCVANAAYKAADLSNLDPANVRSGASIAGVTGVYAGASANCVSDGEIGCITTAAYQSADMSHVTSSNIKSGVTIAGVPGVLTPAPNACVTDGETACVANSSYPAVDLTTVSSGNIRNGVTIAGVSGTYPSLMTPLVGSSGGVADLVSMNSTTAAGNYEFFDSTGVRYVGSIQDAGTIIPGISDNVFNAAALYRQFTVKGDTDLVATNIKSTIDIFGVVGNVVAAPASCSADGQSACVVDGAFKAADTSGFTAADLRSGKSVAGVPGSLADCAADGDIACVANNAFRAADMTAVSAGNIKSGVQIAGINGDYPSTTYPLPSASPVVADLISSNFNTQMRSATGFEYWDSAGTHYSGSGDGDILAGNIKSGIDIFGVAGNVAGSSGNCAADGQIGCVTTSTYIAANVNNVVAGNIKNGASIAGIAGTYPSLATPLKDATGTNDLISLDANTAAGAYEFFDSAGTRYIGTVVDAGSVTPSSSNQTFSAGIYRGFTVAGDADLNAANIKDSVNIFGVVGTLDPAPDDCSSNAEVGCVTTTNYKAADFTNLTAANIKKNAVVAGVTGDYPSAAHKLMGSDATTDLPDFAATAGGATYQWFKADGSRVTGTIQADATVTPSIAAQNLNAGLYRSVSVNGDADLIATNIRTGVNIFGVNGSVVETPANCSSDSQMGCVTTAAYKAADMNNVVPGNIKNAIVIAGVTGALSGAPANCSANGELGCVTTGSYKAADFSSIVSGNIKNNAVVAGVTGTYPSLATPLAGASPTNDLVSLDATTASGSYEFFDSTGAHYTGMIADAGTVTPGISNQTFNTALYRQFTVLGDADLTGAHIKNGVDIFSVTGTLTPAPDNCSGNGEIGCVTTATFKAADLTNLSAGNIKNGVSIAGTFGQYPSATYKLTGTDGTTALTNFASAVGGTAYQWFQPDGTRVTGTIQADATVTPSTTAQVLNAGLYRSVSVNGDANLVTGNIKNGVSIFGVNGSVVPSAANCTSDAQIGCVTTASFKAADMTNVIQSNIKDTVTIAGVTGNLTGAPANCSASGQQGCVTTATFKSADLTNLLSGNIKNGVTIAGMPGTYPSLTTPLAGATGTNDLVSMGPTTAAGTYEFFDSTGTRYTGDITDAGSVTPGITNQNFSASLYRQFTVLGDSDLAAVNIKNSVNIFGVVGTLTPAPNTCTSNAEQGCVTNATYKAADLTNLSAGNIRAGVTIAGTPGQYPSSTYRLVGSDATTDLPAFGSTVGGSTYEWFQPDGTRLTGTIQADVSATPTALAQTFNTGLYRSVSVSGDANLVAANIKSGVNIFGVSGSVVPSPASCSTDSQVGCVTTTLFKAADMTNVIATNIKNSVVIAGVTGSLIGAPANCSANAETGCVTTASFKAADFSTIVSGNIKNGASVAGVTGTYPSVATPLAGNTATTDLTTLTGTTAAGSYEFFDSTGAIHSGSIVDLGTLTPSASTQAFTSAVYRQFTMSGDANLVGSNIKTGVSIFGVSGSLTPSPGTCSSDAQVGCVTTSTYKAANTGAITTSDLRSGKTIAGIAGALADCAADGAISCVANNSYKAVNMTNVTAGNVKSGVILAGVTGDYPSSTYRLSGATATADLISTNFNAQVASATAFEYWDSAGARQTGAGDADLAAGNIKNAIDILGVTGTINAAPSNCSSNGEVGCVTTSSYKAADLSNLVAGNIKNSISIAGVTGSYPSAGTPLSGNTATADLVALNNTTVAGSYEFFDSAGTRYTGTVTDIGTVTPTTSNTVYNGASAMYRSVTVAGSANLVAANIKSGVSLFSLTGTLTPAPANCAADGVTGCVTTASYPSADLSTFSAGDIKATKTVAGIAGSLANCSAEGVAGCVTTSTYKSVNIANVTAGNIKSSVVIMGVTGDYPSATYPLPSADTTADLDSSSFSTKIKSATAFEYWNSAGARQTGAGDANLVATNIKSGVSIFSVAGSVVPSPGGCAANGVTGCVTTATYKSADLTNLSAGNIKNGVTIAGTAGLYPNATYTLSGASVTTDLTSMAAATAAGSYEFWDSAGTRYTGSITDAATITPSASNQTFSTSLYRQFTVSGDVDLVASNIKGSVNIFGVNGGYPSATYPLASNTSTTDLTTATFNAQVKSATAFEYFDSAGTAYTGAGDTDIIAGNIVSGKDIFGTTGTASAGSTAACTTEGSTDCKVSAPYYATNTSNYSAWDIRAGKTVATYNGLMELMKSGANLAAYDNSASPGVSGLDMFDSIDDYNNNGTFPMSYPTGWPQNVLNKFYMDPASDVGTGGGTAGNNSCDGGEACVFIDRITNTYWAKDVGTVMTWQAAIDYCNNLSYGPYTDWRLPTQKELLQAYVDGIWYLKATNKLSLQTTYAWAATASGAAPTTNAYLVYLHIGSQVAGSKSGTGGRPVCIRP